MKLSRKTLIIVTMILMLCIFIYFFTRTDVTKPKILTAVTGVELNTDIVFYPFEIGIILS